MAIVSRWSAVVFLAGTAGACGATENPAIRAFYASVKPGAPVLDVIREGERIQKAEASFSVVSQDCPGPFVSIARVPGTLHIRVTQPAAVSNPSSEPGYTETGYSSRDEFSRALQHQLPPFYSCKTFRFEFSRDQFWPTSDAFTVTVDPSGKVTSLSELTEH